MVTEDERVSLESLLPFIKEDDLGALVDGVGSPEGRYLMGLAAKELDNRDYVRTLLEQMDRAFDGSLS